MQIMEKINRSLALCGLLAAFGLGSCLTTTNELDLNKEISLDMQIGPGGLSIPLGSLDTLFLDSLIKIDGDDSMLKKLDDGTFGISMEGTVDTVKVEIEPLSISIDPPSIDPITTSFDTPKKDDLKMNIPSDSILETLEISSVDLSGMNGKFNKIALTYDTRETAPIPVNYAGIPVNKQSIDVPTQNQNISFAYTLPADVERLNTIYFGEDGSTTGQKITLDVDLGGIYSVLDNPLVRIKSLDVTFPGNFELAEDEQLGNYIKNGSINVSGNVLSISMSEGQYIETLQGDSKILPLTFYLVSADFSGEGHSIDYSGKISYSLTLEVSGTSKGTGVLYVYVSLDENLQIADFSVDTRAKQMVLPSDALTSSFKVGGLGGMKRINYIDFDVEQSVIKFFISDFDIAPFTFDESSYIKLVFSNDFEFDKTVDFQGKARWTYDVDHENILLVDPSRAKGNDVTLHVKRLNMYKDVDKTSGSISMSNDVEYSSSITVAPKTGLNKAGLSALHSQNITFKVSGDLFVDDADFTIDEITTSLNSSTKINVEKGGIDKSLEAIKRIDIDDNNPAGVTMNLKFEGVPDQIDELRIADMTITLPDFIKMRYSGNDAGTYIDRDGSIVINRVVTESELSSSGNGLTISGFFIDRLEFDTLLVLDDGWLRLLNQQVTITGEATVPESNLGLAGLDNITVTPSVIFNTITVKSAYGKVNPEIDEVHESVDLSLGDDNDFFQNENNTLSLSDPQIVINLTSSVTLPIDIDLSLSSYDSKGNYIGREIKPDMGTIHLQKCDSLEENRKTTLVIYKNDRPVSATQEDTLFVRMSRLSELMSTIPDKIEFNLDAGVNQDVNHFVDLTRPLYVSGDYSVSIPLSFDSLFIEYSDTIKDLSEDLEEIADKIDATELKIVADIESTIPLGVELSATAYDKRGMEMDDIKISPCLIKAGSDTITESEMILDVDIKNGKRLADLDMIIFTAACRSGEGSSSIRDGQWLWIKKLRIQLPQGLKVDLTDSMKDKK